MHTFSVLYIGGDVKESILENDVEAKAEVLGVQYQAETLRQALDIFEQRFVDQPNCQVVSISSIDEHGRIKY